MEILYKHLRINTQLFDYSITWNQIVILTEIKNLPKLGIFWNLIKFNLCSSILPLNRTNPFWKQLLRSLGTKALNFWATISPNWSRKSKLKRITISLSFWVTLEKWRKLNQNLPLLNCPTIWMNYCFLLTSYWPK